EQAAGHEAVTAVVPGPCQDRDHAAGRRPRHNGVGDRPAGVLHQFDTGDPTRDRKTIGFAHLGVGQKLDHRAHGSGMGSRRRPSGQLFGNLLIYYSPPRVAAAPPLPIYQYFLETKRFSSTCGLGTDPANRWSAVVEDPIAAGRQGEMKKIEAVIKPFKLD